MWYPQYGSASLGEAVISNHLNISSVWKLPVASCLCVAEVQTRVFNELVSSTKVFVSSTKHVNCLQCDIVFWGEVAKTISLLAMSRFVFYLELGLEILPKWTETIGKKVLKKLCSFLSISAMTKFECQDHALQNYLEASSLLQYNNWWHYSHFICTF